MIASLFGYQEKYNYLERWEFTTFLSVPDVFANLIGIAFGTLVNYFMNSLWTWRETPKTSSHFPKGLQ
jgi:putative flippase GtrA